MKIAVSGKGGTGKTTIAALIISYLLNKNLKPLLAVDADPNSNLGDALGVKIENTVGRILDEFLKNKETLSYGVAKEDFLEHKLYEILIEEKGFDLLVMGQGEGPGCYCYPNTVIRSYIEKLSKNYKYIVIDNEAGMEHISRRTNGDLDVLFLISDPTIKGIKTCGKLQDLTKELKINIKNTYLIINRIKKEIPATILDEAKKQNLNLLGVIPEDEAITNLDTKGIPLFNLPESSASVIEIKNLMEKILSQN